MHRPYKSECPGGAGQNANQHANRANSSSDSQAMQSATPNVQDIADGSAFLQALTRIAVALKQQNNQLMAIDLTVQDVGRYS